MDNALSSVTQLGSVPTGSLRINGSEAALRLLMADIIPSFMQRYPGIELDLVTDNQLNDVIKDGFDAGIRLYEDISQDMVAVRVSSEIRFITVASSVYLRQSQPPNVPQDLYNHVCIRQRLPGGKRYAWEYIKGDVTLSLDVPGSLTLNNSQLMVEAACAGHGITYVPELYAAKALHAGELQTLLEEWSPVSAGLYLYFPHNRYMSFAMTQLLAIVRERQPAIQSG